jgi:hippurate hydrolase
MAHSPVDTNQPAVNQGGAGDPETHQATEIAVRQATTLFSALPALLPAIEDLYRDLHRHPELSGQERQTATTVATHLEAAGYTLTRGVGGHGVVGLLRHGAGPTVALRADMDALPIAEQTGLPYASTATAIGAEGVAVPVMHACGHDLHTACLVGAAQLLAGARDLWQGTLMIVGQPAEETMRGAAAMLVDGLFTSIARPDVVLGQHVINARAGDVIHRAGTLFAAERSVRVRIFGTGRHGAQPQRAVDPAVIGAYAVTRLQTIVSRELGMSTPGGVTVGSFHAGTCPTRIPDEATLELSVRTLDNAVADGIVAAIERIVRAECAAGGAPRDPEIAIIERKEALVNDVEAVGRVQAAHAALFSDAVWSAPAPIPFSASEDFALYGLPGSDRYAAPPIPLVYWLLGGTAPATWAQAPGSTYLEKLHTLPANHSAAFAPDPGVTLRRGVEALTSAALAYLSSPM